MKTGCEKIRLHYAMREKKAGPSAVRFHPVERFSQVTASRDIKADDEGSSSSEITWGSGRRSFDVFRRHDFNFFRLRDAFL